MKTYYFLFVVALILVLNSCTTEDFEEPQKKSINPEKFNENPDMLRVGDSVITNIIIIDTITEGDPLGPPKGK
ncbi:hypothetical protein ABGT15_04910 [Flavobacterium enshiense]|uniref:hypothetical protein n=1 Tax=Flavobacterium enshiense TaxID=1341165 RepID=UPI00345C866F